MQSRHNDIASSYIQHRVRYVATGQEKSHQDDSKQREKHLYLFHDRQQSIYSGAIFFSSIFGRESERISIHTHFRDIFESRLLF
jgi:hypothetical protein